VEVLSGHVDPESAYIIADYPYSFRLRCQMRVWVETTKHGQRIMRQTSNPKRGGWNKPKASTYSPVLLMALGDDGHVTTIAPNIYDADSLKEFETAYLADLDNYQRNTIAYLIAGRRAMKRVTYTVHSCSGPCDDPIHSESYAQREKHNRRIVSSLVRDELRKESNAAMVGEEFNR
jgi:hypothetical protein